MGNIKKILTLIGLGFLTLEPCHAEDITIRYNGSQAKVTQTKKDSVNVTIDFTTVR